MKFVLHAALLATLILAPATALAQAEPEPTEPEPTEPESTEAESAAGETAEVLPPGADLTEANEKVREGDYVGAEEVLAELEGEFPDDVRLLLMRGELLISLKRFDEAIPVLRRTTELDPERPRAHFQLATALQGMGDLEGALEAYRLEAEINEDTRVKVMARVNRSMLLEKGGDWEGAAAELEAALADAPEEVEIYGDLVSLCLQAKKLDDAARYLDRGYENGFRSAEHYYILGARLYQNEAYEEAVAAFERTLEINPKAAVAERSLAGALDQLDRPEEVVEHLRRYLELQPDAADAEKARKRIAEIEGS